MPKIFLKPNSAEFAETETTAKVQRCEMPGCRAEGQHKAPKDRALKEYYHFCFDHVREYNKAWNFFSGMANHEVEEHMINAMYGDRPTRRWDNHEAAEEILKRKAWQTYNFTEKEPPKNGGYDYNSSYNATYNRNTPEYEAMAIMGLTPPVKLKDIKARYKELAKKHHPDLNGGCNKAEELLKEVNMAYTILKVAYEQFEKLPDKN